MKERTVNDSEKAMKRPAAPERAEPAVRSGIRWAVAAGMIGLLGVLLYLSLSSSAIECTVCVTFDGRTECRSARAATRDESIRTASATACAVLATGMAESLRCERTPPTSMACR